MNKFKIVSNTMKSTELTDIINNLLSKIQEVKNQFVLQNISEEEFDNLLIDIAKQYRKEISKIIPEWSNMCIEKNGETELHVMRVFVALLMTQYYQKATLEKKKALEVIVLFHDIAKAPIQKSDGSWERDAIHPFMSAIIAAKNLLKIGYRVTDNYSKEIDSWVDLVRSSVKHDSRKGHHGEFVQDNSNLKEILDGIERMFGKDSIGSNIIKTILLHQSITFIQDWPAASPLSEKEIKDYLSESLLSFMSSILMADSDAWQLFTDNRFKYEEYINVKLNDIFQMIRR